MSFFSFSGRPKSPPAVGGPSRLNTALPPPPPLPQTLGIAQWPRTPTPPGYVQAAAGYIEPIVSPGNDPNFQTSVVPGTGQALNIIPDIDDQRETELERQVREQKERNKVSCIKYRAKVKDQKKMPGLRRGSTAQILLRTRQRPHRQIQMYGRRLLL
jgi:hypothetical protein